MSNLCVNFYTKLAESSFLCRFRIESVNVFVLPRFDLCHVLSSSPNNFAHAQTLSRMSSLSGRVNIARVNIGFFTGFKKIKQRCISFVLGYLCMLFHISSIFDFFIGVEMVMCRALICVKEIHQPLT